MEIILFPFDLSEVLEHSSPAFHALVSYKNFYYHLAMLLHHLEHFSAIYLKSLLQVASS